VDEELDLTSRSFQAFLSHRYKSPSVNLYFFDLFSEVAEPQFEVDAGHFATNVTRLERMMRASEAFLGIYPFTDIENDPPSREKLLSASKYFRLEFEMAIRAQKLALVFFDKRYKGLFIGPTSMWSMEFDALEVTGRGGSPRATHYRQTLRWFSDMIFKAKQYLAPQPGRAKTGVALALPPETGEKVGYSREAIDTIQSVLEERGFDDIRIVKWPPLLDQALVTLLADVDWVIADIGDDDVGMSLLAYLHGAFVPTMRLWRVEDPLSPLPTFARTLYGWTEVGYEKDILRWNDPQTLLDGLSGRLVSLEAPVRRISTSQEARAYFEEASLRKEAVFLSYSGKDQDFARSLSSELRKRFQVVFDYRDGQSIRPGEPWIQEIFDQLATAAVGIPLYSKDYLASGNCVHELEQMVALSDSHKLALMPIKLYRDDLILPSFVEHLQYLRSWEYEDSAVLADRVNSLIAKTETDPG
jgi:TIR domain